MLPSKLVLSRAPPLVPPLDALSFSSYAEVFRRRPVLTWITQQRDGRGGLDAAVRLAIADASRLNSLSRFNTPAQRAAGATLLLSKMLPSLA